MDQLECTLLKDGFQGTIRKKPLNADQLERTLLKGVFSVRKGKTQLHKWAERQVVLCGTCLIVASVKDSLMGKMHILPLVGGKVEEVKRRQYCLMFSSAGPQAQTYFVNFDMLADYQSQSQTSAEIMREMEERNGVRIEGDRVVSQTVSLVDLSCYSLEGVPECLFYSQDITHLNLRHNFMSLEGPGGLQNLSSSQTLSLSDCSSQTLSLSDFILQTLSLSDSSLQTLSLDGNHLSTLPEELGGLAQICSLGLSFNDFPHIPTVLDRLTGVDRLAMAGNRVETLELGTLGRMTHLKNIDLRLPPPPQTTLPHHPTAPPPPSLPLPHPSVLQVISEPGFRHVVAQCSPLPIPYPSRLNGLRWVQSEGLEAVKQVTYLDLRDNQLTSLDLSSACNLETLHCQRNHLGALTLSGFTLRTLCANSNHWVCDTRKIEVLDITHNLLSVLPPRSVPLLLSSLSLRKLLVGNNQLERLPDLLDHIPLEALDLQHNKLGMLPESLFCRALNLRYLNVSANSLESLPPSSQSEESLSTLQELYLTSNNLNENCAALLLSKLELLEELNLSGNKLKTIPSTVSSCKKLHTLIAHSNHISVFPDILNLPEIKLVDLSCNNLTEILLPDSLPPTLQELDLSGNRSLMLEHKTLNLFSHITTLKLDQKPAVMTGDSMSSATLWRHGYSEMSGQRNKLCVSVLAVDHFGDNVEATYGIFDGDRNEEVPRLLQCTMGDVLSEELQQSSVDNVFMDNTFLTSHRKLGMAGQKLGSSALLCYIHHEPSDPASYFTLTVANVGTCQAVLCRDGHPLPLSKVFSLEQNAEEMERVKQGKAIVTERERESERVFVMSKICSDNKVSGVTCCSRLLGCSYLSPWVLPKPWVHTEPLSSQDDFLILGNKALFQRMSYKEAVCTVQAVRDPCAAAKKLCTLAQSYGCRDNVGAVVVSLCVGEDSCTCEPPLAPSEGKGGTGPVTLPVSVALGDPAMPSSSSGIASEFSSEASTSEVGSEAGSTASDENPSSGTAFRPERRCSLHPASTGLPGSTGPVGPGGPHPGLFQRQPSSATFSSNQSDNGLDSDDESPLEGVISNGSKLEVEVDIHCCAFQIRSGAPKGSDNQDPRNEQRCLGYHGGGLAAKLRRQNSVVVSATNGCLLAVCGREISDLKKSPSTSSLFGKKLSNGSVVALEDSHNIIEVALEAPKKKSGYFSAPAQQDPEDQLVVPAGLEQDVKEQLRGQTTVVPGPLLPPSTPPTTREPAWEHPRPPQLPRHDFPFPTALPQEVYDTAL
ncbi:hypothetical protein JZ751_020916 [Albula glossodonta]|uniref:PPM-type phosphatase domain-containing protein n=1 Tax=Albula glossodonta TaxID=121402 RepID=A0A8T2PN74_9TELE|nr:hypothetical protein JZ751_020916 [Albula glossodonta]